MRLLSFRLDAGPSEKSVETSDFGYESGYILTRMGDEILVGVGCSRQLDVVAARRFAPGPDEVRSAGVIAPLDEGPPRAWSG